MTRQYKTQFKLTISALGLLLFALAPPLSANPASVIKAAKVLVKENDELIKSGTLSPDDMVKVHMESSELTRLAKNYDESVAHAAKALEIDPTNTAAKALLKNALKKKDFEFTEGMFDIYAFGIGLYAGGIGTTLLLQSLMTD